MKNGKSCGPDGIPTEALQHLGDWGVRQLTNIFNARDIVTISDGQFGFKSGVGTTDAIFVIRTLCEKYR